MGEVGPGFLLLLGFIALAILLILIGIGIVLALAFLILATVLVLTGIVTSSSLIAFFQRRAANGVIAFFIQLGAVSGLAVGIGIMFILYLFVDWQVNFFLLILFGAFAGLVTGSLIGTLFSIATLRTYHWLAKRIPLRHHANKQIFSQT